MSGRYGEARTGFSVIARSAAGATKQSRRSKELDCFVGFTSSQ
jgi:hypothetical protein